MVIVANTNIKARVLRKWTELVDDVTRTNKELIAALLKHSEIISMWYFNRSVFGKMTSNEERVQFDILDDIQSEDAIIIFPVYT